MLDPRRSTACSTPDRAVASFLRVLGRVRRNALDFGSTEKVRLVFKQRPGRKFDLLRAVDSEPTPIPSDPRP
jgi:hypothetical protein